MFIVTQMTRKSHIEMKLVRVRSWSKKAVNGIIGALDQTRVSERSQKLEGDKIDSESGG